MCIKHKSVYRLYCKGPLRKDLVVKAMKQHTASPCVINTAYE